MHLTCFIVCDFLSLGCSLSLILVFFFLCVCLLLLASPLLFAVSCHPHLVHSSWVYFSHFVSHVLLLFLCFISILVLVLSSSAALIVSTCVTLPLACMRFFFCLCCSQTLSICVLSGIVKLCLLVCPFCPQIL